MEATECYKSVVTTKLLFFIYHRANANFPVDRGEGPLTSSFLVQKKMLLLYKDFFFSPKSLLDESTSSCQDRFLISNQGVAGLAVVIISVTYFENET